MEHAVFAPPTAPVNTRYADRDLKNFGLAFLSFRPGLACPCDAKTPIVTGTIVEEP